MARGGDVSEVLYFWLDWKAAFLPDKHVHTRVAQRGDPASGRASSFSCIDDQRRDPVEISDSFTKQGHGGGMTFGGLEYTQGAFEPGDSWLHLEYVLG